MNTTANNRLLLNGPDGGNPLGFLAALGCFAVAQTAWADLRMAWQNTDEGWRAEFHGCDSDQQQFMATLLSTMQQISMQAFEIDTRLPFDRQTLRETMLETRRTASSDDRRTIDFLAGFGSELGYDEKKSTFRDTRLRMARSGDADGNGLTAYAIKLRDLLTEEKLQQALFETWRYLDVFYTQIEIKNGKNKKSKKPVPAFRWDPVDDRRYALRWGNPTQKHESDIGTVLAANALAVEALQILPTMPTTTNVQTTGFHRKKRETWFTWPIWETSLHIDTLRSVLTLPQLRQQPLPSDALQAMGICEVFHSQRIQQSKYYSNFTPARSL